MSASTPGFMTLPQLDPDAGTFPEKCTPPDCDSDGNPMPHRWRYWYVVEFDGGKRRHFPLCFRLPWDMEEPKVLVEFEGVLIFDEDGAKNTLVKRYSIDEVPVKTAGDDPPDGMARAYRNKTDGSILVWDPERPGYVGAAGVRVASLSGSDDWEPIRPLDPSDPQPWAIAPEVDSTGVPADDDYTGWAVYDSVDGRGHVDLRGGEVTPGTTAHYRRHTIHGVDLLERVWVAEEEEKECDHSWEPPSSRCTKCGMTNPRVDCGDWWEGMDGSNPPPNGMALSYLLHDHALVWDGKEFYQSGNGYKWSPESLGKVNPPNLEPIRPLDMYDPQPWAIAPEVDYRGDAPLPGWLTWIVYDGIGRCHVGSEMSEREAVTDSVGPIAIYRRHTVCGVDLLEMVWSDLPRGSLSALDRPSDRPPSVDEVDWALVESGERSPPARILVPNFDKNGKRPGRSCTGFVVIRSGALWSYGVHDGRALAAYSKGGELRGYRSGHGLWRVIIDGPDGTTATANIPPAPLQKDRETRLLDKIQANLDEANQDLADLRRKILGEP